MLVRTFYLRETTYPSVVSEHPNETIYKELFAEVELNLLNKRVTILLSPQ
jgi:hypothetical protein